MKKWVLDVREPGDWFGRRFVFTTPSEAWAALVLAEANGFEASVKWVRSRDLIDA